MIESYMVGGAEKVVWELCTHLQRSGYIPSVVTLKQGWLTERLSDVGVECVLVENRRSFDIGFLNNLVHVIRKRNIDLIHSHEFLMNTYGMAASVITGRPLVATVHGKGYYGERWRRKIAFRLVGRKAFRTVAVSHHLKKYLVEKFEFPPSNVSVIHNGIDLKRFSDDSDLSETDRLKKELGLKGLVIGTVGNIYPVKGHIHLVRAAREVINEFPETCFVVVGKITDHHALITEEIKKLNLDGRFLFPGFRDDVPEILKLMDIFVLPSLEETYSIATIEALASGKPVVATRCGGPEEIITEGIHGFLVPPADSERLAEKICELIRNQDLRRSMGDAGKRLVGSFSTEEMFQKYERLYEEAWMQ